MTSLKEYKAHRKALKAQIKETKALLTQLENELENEREEMQHEEVDHLEEYLDKANPQLRDLKTLGSSALEDLRKNLNHLLQSLSGKK